MNRASIGRRITPSEHQRAKPGRQHFAFVDLETEQEARAAIQALDQRLWNGERLRVSVPKDLPRATADKGIRR